jgi:hypothetical protein
MTFVTQELQELAAGKVIEHVVYDEPVDDFCLYNMDLTSDLHQRHAKRNN